MKQFLIILLFIISAFAGCDAPAPKNAELPSESIFHLSSDWQNQDGKHLKLKELQGKTLVVVMFYTSCKVACPILVASMKKIGTEIKPKYLKNVSLVLVSIDPETDTPQRLKEFAITNGMSEPQWIFLHGNEAATQEFANVLSMKYKEISPIDFSHSNIISVFSPDGKLQNQEEGLNIDTKKVAKLVNETVGSN